MGQLRIAKGAAQAAVPFSAVSEPAPTPVGEPKSLTVKISAEDYWALRDYCAQQGRKTGKRVTHQDVMVEGLHRVLGKHRGREA